MGLDVCTPPPPSGLQQGVTWLHPGLPTCLQQQCTLINQFATCVQAPVVPRRVALVCQAAAQADVEVEAVSLPAGPKEGVAYLRFQRGSVHKVLLLF